MFFVVCTIYQSAGQQTGKNLSPELVLQLNPGPDNPRNSEGDFVTLRDGRILFVYTHYTGESTDDHAPAFLAGRYSSDGGKTWSDKDEVIVKGEGAMNFMSVSFLRMKNGKIAMFYLRKNAETDCIPMVRFSSDETRTWSEPAACITDRKGYFVLNNNRVIQLSNGRLLMAVARHRTPDTKWENKGALFSYYSDDYGISWKSGAAIPDTTSIITQEPGVIELKDGKIMMFIRASEGFQMLSYSTDKGETWSHIEKSNIYSPVSPASIARIPLSGNLLMVWNNNKIREAGWHGGKRTPLTMAISNDEGKTWINIRDIETDPDGWFCYTAIHFTKRDVLLGYCAGSQLKKTHLSVLNITRLSQKMLYQK
jgi:Neuraminidase (sialidase)